MSTRRGNNEGSITKLKNGSYRGRLLIGRTEDGKRLYKNVNGKTKKECLARLEELKREHHLGLCIKSDETTVKEWLLYWLKYYKKVSIKPSTYDRYETLILNNISPAIGGYRLQNLTTRDVQALYNNIIDQGYVSSTVHKIHNVLRPALRQAQIEGIVNKNVAEFTTLPSKNKRNVVVFTKEEQKLFIEAAEGFNTYEAFVFNLNTGLRMAELLALTWDDINFEKKEVYINKSYIRVKNRDDDKTLHKFLVQDSSKTSNSTRTVPLTNQVVNLLKKLKMRRQSKTNIVFCSTNYKHIRPRNYERAFERTLLRANLKKCNTHTMRHTFATRLFEAEVPAKTISELLGHSSVSFTLDTYVTVLPNTKKEAINVLEDLIVL